MKKRLLLFFTAVCSVVTLASAEPAANPIPNPELLLQPDSFSIGVVQLRPDDEAVKQLLAAALDSIAKGEAKLPASMAETSQYLSQNNRADMLFKGLPFQGMRIDRLLPNKQTSPTYAFTLAGWRGLQSNVFNTLTAGPDGKALPSTLYHRVDMFAREHAEDPTWASTLCRINGSFVFAPSVDVAKKIIDRLMPQDKPPGPASGPLLSAYQALPKTSDAYGVILNPNGGLSALLKSQNNEYIEKVRQKIGNDRLERVVAATKSVTWKVDITSADKADMEAVWTLDPKSVAEAASALEEGKTNLDATKISDVTITPSGNTVTVKGAVVNLKKLMLDSLASGAIK